MAGSSITDIRRNNRDMVMRDVSSNAPISRSQISQNSGLTGAAVSRITRELIDVGLIREGKKIEVKGRVGRRNIHLELASNGAFVLGITLTANVQSVSIGNIQGETIDCIKIAEQYLSTPETIVEKLSIAAHNLIKSSNVDPNRLVGCGVSIGGVVNSEAGVLIRSDPLGWKNIQLASMFSEKLGLPVKIEGRAVALLLAEQGNKVGRSNKNVVLISNSLWVGGAMMLDGKIVKGQSDMIGQIGHFSVNGLQTPCSCGRKGCLDAVASGQAILRKLEYIKLNEKNENHNRLRILADESGSINPEVNAAFKEAGQRMGYAVDALLSILDPEQILLSGATQRQQYYIKGIYETLANLRPNQTDWPVKVSQVTSEQSAVWLALNAFIFSPCLNIDQLKIT